MLKDTEQSQSLLQSMDEALATLPLDFESAGVTYDQKVQLLTEVHQYVEGTYTISRHKSKRTDRGTDRTSDVIV